VTIDPTTAAIEVQTHEREELRAENQRLRRELTAACTEFEAVKAERTTRADASFVAGYDQAVLEIRDHFAKAGDHGVVHVIETTWLRHA
jgi:hypothetical protein